MIDQNRIFRFDQQTVEIDDFPAEGFILDIGGGGEGVIGTMAERTGFELLEQSRNGQTFFCKFRRP
jgi:hypothetical protein